MDPYQHTEVDTEQSSEQFAGHARGMQIVGGALVVGCLPLTAMMIFLKGISGEIYEGAGLATWLGIGFGCLTLVGSFVVPSVVGRRQGDSIEAWCVVFRGKTTAGMALCEGGAFMNSIMYLLDGQLISLGMVVLLMLRLVMQIPTAGGLQSWVGDRMRSVEQGFEQA